MFVKIDEYILFDTVREATMTVSGKAIINTEMISSIQKITATHAYVAESEKIKKLFEFLCQTEAWLISMSNGTTHYVSEETLMYMGGKAGWL